ncbi:MAG TPA: restriction endonuclease subunit S [Verrucomicrobiae bacterium]
MTKPWPTVRLGEVLRQRREFVTIDDLTNYKRPRVQLHVQGIVLRDEVPGALIKTKTQQVCLTGEFLVAEIDAKVGGFGIVPESLDGSIVSSHYFLFVIDEAKLDPRFLAFFIRTPAFREQVAAQGSTNYAAIRPAHVLGYEIPLPPLAEQRRIVARIEELAAQIHEARSLRHQAAEETDALLVSAQSALTRPQHADAATVEALAGKDGLRNGKSVKSTGSESEIRCLTLSSMRNGRIDTRDNKPVPMSREEAQAFQVRPGQVYVVRGNGSKDLCGCAGMISGAAEGVIFPDLFIQVSLPQDRMLPEFFVAAWNSSATRTAIEEKAKTTSGIWKINQGHILTTQIPVPPLPEQRRIVAELDALQAQVTALKRLQAETAAELDALLPAILDRAFKGNL